MNSEYPIRIVKGNYFLIAQPLSQITWENSTKQVIEYIPSENDKITVTLVGGHDKYNASNILIEGSRLQYDFNGNINTGTYGVEVKITQADGKRLRSYQKEKIQIVNSNEEAGIRGGDEFDVNSYELDGAVLLVLKGPKGDKGNDGTVAFENLTPLQREMLKGDRGDDGVGIAYIEQTVEGVGSDADNVMVFTLTGNIENPVRYELHVKNGGQGEPGIKGDTGVSIERVEQTVVSDEDGGVNEATITLNDKQHTQTVIQFRNGQRGNQGPQGDTVLIGEGKVYLLYNTPGNNTDGAMTQKAVSAMFESVESIDVARMSDPQ